jgi:hypothetical protein
MRESRTSGSARGAGSNPRPYRDQYAPHTERRIRTSPYGAMELAGTNDATWCLIDASSLSASHDWAHYVRRGTARIRDHSQRSTICGAPNEAGFWVLARRAKHCIRQPRSRATRGGAALATTAAANTPGPKLPRPSSSLPEPKVSTARARRRCAVPSSSLRPAVARLPHLLRGSLRSRLDRAQEVCGAGG